MHIQTDLGARHVLPPCCRPPAALAHSPAPGSLARRSPRRSCYGLDPSKINATVITQKVIQGVYDGVTTHELDELAAQTAAYMATQHPDFSRLAARISVLTQRRK